MELLTSDGGSLRRYTFWVARAAGRIVAFAIVTETLTQNPHLLMVDLDVHPDFRRRGIGTRLFRALIPEARKLGRTHVEGLSLLQGGAGDHWAAASGSVKPSAP